MGDTDHEFEASLGYIVKPHSNNNQKRSPLYEYICKQKYAHIFATNAKSSDTNYIKNHYR
jgi:hypothetical protein